LVFVGDHFNMDDITAQAGTHFNRSTGVVLPSLIADLKSQRVKKMLCVSYEKRLTCVSNFCRRKISLRTIAEHLPYPPQI
jgi:hypothetical protein